MSPQATFPAFCDLMLTARQSELWLHVEKFGAHYYEPEEGVKTPEMMEQIVKITVQMFQIAKDKLDVEITDIASDFNVDGIPAPQKQELKNKMEAKIGKRDILENLIKWVQEGCATYKNIEEANNNCLVTFWRYIDLFGWDIQDAFPEIFQKN